jgi:hypothetical protein
MSVTRIDKVIKTVPLLCHFYYHRKGMKARHQVISMNQEILAEGEASVRLTSLLRPAAFDTETTFSFLFTKQPILMRISTVLSLPLQLVFPALTVEKCFFFFLNFCSDIFAERSKLWILSINFRVGVLFST